MTTSPTWKESWLGAVAPDEPHKLDRRLAWESLTEDAFRHWLETGAGDGDEPLPWREALEDCRAALKASWDAELLEVAPGEQRPFLDLWWPFRKVASSRLADALTRGAQASGASHGGIDPGVFDKLADSLMERLCTIGEKALWDRFSAGRTPGAMLLAHLGAKGDGSGPPAREHYGALIRSLRRDGLSDLLSEFPELGRFIGTAIVLWQRASEETLRRIRADRDVLDRLFSVSPDHVLTDIRQGLSDPHYGGRVVSVLSFSGEGSDHPVRVVYKPKNMGVDAAYQLLLHDLNANSDLPPLRALAVHAGDGYGYMEFVAHTHCADAGELERFYANAGRLTALLHILGCTDCHHENLFASGDQLVLVDTETLLEPDPLDFIDDASADGSRSGLSRLQKRFDRSVLRSGLLPQWTFLGDARQPVDISALGIHPPLGSEQTVSGWHGINSDGMMPGSVSVPAELPTSLPVGAGARNPLFNHLDVFCSAYESQCRELIRLRQFLLAEDGPLSRFAGLPRRIVLRATRVYMTIQKQMLEPEALRSPFVRAVKLEQLARTFLLAEEKPLRWPVLEAERRQMQQLDVPFFSNLIDGDALVLDRTGTTLPGFVRHSGLAMARDHLQMLDEEEIAFQIRLVRGVVQARRLRVGGQAAQVPGRASPGAAPSPEAQTDGFDAARRLAVYLRDQAIEDPGGHVEWLGTSLGQDGERFTYGPVGLSLYGGSIGIACLLDALAHRPEAPEDASRLREAILLPLRELAEEATEENRLRWWRDQSLGLSGCGGILLALQHLGEPEIAHALIGAVRQRFLETDQQLDLIGGCAGLIGPLLTLESGTARALAIICGDQLLRHQGEDGSWGMGSKTRLVLGLAHGTAGCAAALARLHHATGEDRFRQGAAAALALERSHFSEEQGNWPDYRNLRSARGTYGFSVGWCNGAPGIAISRACLWGTDLWDAECEREISIAIRTTAAVDDLGADHLCCGNLSLMLALQILCDGPWPVDAETRKIARQAIARHRSAALQRCFQDPISLRCFGTENGSVMLPGFFSGVSGMGLALLQDSKAKTKSAAFFSGGLLPGT